MSAVPDGQAGVTSGMNSSSRQLGQCLGVAVTGTVLAGSLHGPMQSGFLPAARAGWLVMVGCGLCVLAAGLAGPVRRAGRPAARHARPMAPSCPHCRSPVAGTPPRPDRADHSSYRARQARRPAMPAPTGAPARWPCQDPSGSWRPPVPGRVEPPRGRGPTAEDWGAAGPSPCWPGDSARPRRRPPPQPGPPDWREAGAHGPTHVSATWETSTTTCATTRPSRLAGRSRPGSSCRRLIADRLDIRGLRWGLDGAAVILTLCAVISNGDYPEEYRRFHLEREHRRLYPALRRDNTRSASDRSAHSKRATPEPFVRARRRR